MKWLNAKTNKAEITRSNTIEVNIFIVRFINGTKKSVIIKFYTTGCYSFTYHFDILATLFFLWKLHSYVSLDSFDMIMIGYDFFITKSRAVFASFVT